MATIKKTFSTRLDGVTVFVDGIRAMVSLVDADDPSNVSARFVVVVKDGKVIQPDINEVVDPVIGKASADLWKVFVALVDKVSTEKPIFIRGSVPPQPPQTQSR